MLTLKRKFRAGEGAPMGAMYEAIVPMVWGRG